MSGGYSFVNGLPPPHAPHLYPPNSADAQPAENMWGAVHPHKMEPPPNLEQKMVSLTILPFLFHSFGGACVLSVPGMQWG